MRLCDTLRVTVTDMDTVGARVVALGVREPEVHRDPVSVEEELMLRDTERVKERDFVRVTLVVRVITPVGRVLVIVGDRERVRVETRVLARVLRVRVTDTVADLDANPPH